MSRTKKGLLAAGPLVLAGVLLYLYSAYRTPRVIPREQKEISALTWLPAESGLVAGLHLAELRKQAWLFAMIKEASGEVEEAADYQAFVEATGFDYTRDLDNVWVGVFGASREPTVVGVAQGRFNREKILALARRQGARRTVHQGVAIYEVQTEFRPPAVPGQPRPKTQVRNFAFAFLEEEHLAFGSDTASAARVVDCWQGRAQGVGSDELRRASLEQWAAGQQVWLVDDLQRWQPPAFRNQEALRAVVEQVALGFAVNEKGVETEAAAQCREARQAERLRDNLRLAALAGRFALGRQDDKTIQALGEVLGQLEFVQEDRVLRARAYVPPELLASLLAVPVPAPAQP